MWQYGECKPEWSKKKVNKNLLRSIMGKLRALLGILPGVGRFFFKQRSLGQGYAGKACPEPAEGSARATLVLYVAVLFFLPGLPFGLASPNVHQINVAAAADLSAALQEIADNFKKRSGVEVKLSFGASGALTQQIQNGAPFDVFFSADMNYPKQLIEAGYADQATLYRYAQGKLVLWVPTNSPLDVEHRGMEVLTDPSVEKISMANPMLAPYGRAALAAVKHYGLYEKLRSRLVLGENVAQAAQFVESGNAQAGFVALAHAVAPAMRDKGRYWVVPQDAYPPLDQGVVMISRSQHQEDAKAFLAYIKSPEAAAVLKKYGFAIE